MIVTPRRGNGRQVAGGGGGGGSGFAANKPSGYNTLIWEFDPGWAVPTYAGNIERTIDTGPQSVIYDLDGSNNSRFTAMTGITGTTSGATKCWDLLFPAASYDDGTTFGDIGVPFTATNRLYWSIELWFSTGFSFHPISHKGLRFELDTGNFLPQIKHDNDWWRPSDEESNLNWDAYKLANTAPSAQTWQCWEGRLDRSTNALDIWFAGIAQYSSTAVAVAPTSQFDVASMDGHMGGGLFDLLADQHMRIGKMQLWK